MNISFNNPGRLQETKSANPQYGLCGSGDAAAAAPKAADPFTLAAAAPDPLDGICKAESVDESVLVRDDDIGSLFSKAFDLPPPPMPDLHGEAGNAPPPSA